MMALLPVCVSSDYVTGFGYGPEVNYMTLYNFKLINYSFGLISGSAP